ncbi:MAG: hypothetical protein K8J31_20395, partial [Anaerolineae bacterium]|nr:hypothetical protein [Anaerolineae bacterium]
MARKTTSKPALAKATAILFAVTHRIVGIPRLIRVLLVALFALAVTLSVSPLVDIIYDRHFFSVHTVMIPALVSSGLGLVMYMLGWWLMVGTVG